MPGNCIGILTADTTSPPHPPPPPRLPPRQYLPSSQPNYTPNQAFTSAVNLNNRQPAQPATSTASSSSGESKPTAPHSQPGQHVFPPRPALLGEQTGVQQRPAVSQPSGSMISSQAQAQIPVPAQPIESLPPAFPTNWTRGKLIGAGAFGQVYLGLNNETGEFFAVKQVTLSKDDQLRKRMAEHVKALEAEVLVLKTLRHEHIVQYIGTEQTDDNLNIFLEFVSGGSIASLIDKFGPLKESVIKVYTKQILKGLDYLHQRKIMHRDIKGANILVDKAGIIKLADFGASKKIEDLATFGSMTSHENKSIKGTPYWMAPEVIRQTGHGRPADIWSLACCIIEMATGRPPWSTHHNPVAAMYNVATTGTLPPMPDCLSPEGQDFLKQCFNRIPKNRPNAQMLLKHAWLVRTPLPDAKADAKEAAARAAAISAAAMPVQLVHSPPSPIVEECADMTPSPTLSRQQQEDQPQSELLPPFAAVPADRSIVQYDTVVEAPSMHNLAELQEGPEESSMLPQQQISRLDLPQAPMLMQNLEAMIDSELLNIGSMDGSLSIPMHADMRSSMLTMHFNPMNEPTWQGDSEEARLFAALAASRMKGQDSRVSDQQQEKNGEQLEAIESDIQLELDKTSPRAAIAVSSKAPISGRPFVPPLPPLSHSMGQRASGVDEGKMLKYKAALFAELENKRQEHRASKQLQATQQSGSR